MHEAERQYHHESIKALNIEMEKTNIQTDKLTDLLIAETITKEIYDRKFAQLQNRRKKISVMQEEHQGGNEEFKTAITTLLSLASKAPEIFKSSKTSVKRSLIGFIFSNLRLNGGKLEYTLREPFQSFQNVESYKEWLCSPNKIKLFLRCKALFLLLNHRTENFKPFRIKTLNLNPVLEELRRTRFSCTQLYIMVMSCNS